MKKIGIIALLVSLTVAGWYYYSEKNSQSGNTVDVAALNQTTNLVDRSDLNLAFRYPNSNYTMISAPLGSALQDADLVESFVVVETAGYNAAVENGATEYPPLLTITVFNKPTDEEVSDENSEVSRTERLTAWAKQFPGLTNINGQIIEDVTASSVDGVNGITYTTDGLYKNKTYILAYRDFMYLLTIQSNGDADNDAVFQQIFDSIEF